MINIFVAILFVAVGIYMIAVSKNPRRRYTTGGFYIPPFFWILLIFIVFFAPILVVLDLLGLEKTRDIFSQIGGWVIVLDVISFNIYHLVCKVIGKEHKKR